jgi:hypothetical protein
MENYFIEITVKSTIREELLKFCENGTDWVNPTVGTFFQKHPPIELIFKDSFLKYICENFITDGEFNKCVNIFMLKPWTHYMLHRDVFRSSSINLLINNQSDSISYFQTSEIYNKMHISIEELKYETDKFYLFNSRAPHAVTNRAMPRYLLSISLNKNFNEMQSSLQNYLRL